jgi:hypothetical protein
MRNYIIKNLFTQMYFTFFTGCLILKVLILVTFVKKIAFIPEICFWSCVLVKNDGTQTEPAQTVT